MYMQNNKPNRLLSLIKNELTSNYENELKLQLGAFVTKGKSHHDEGIYFEKVKLSKSL